MRLPLAVSYSMACAIADVHYSLSPKDREAIMANLDVVMGDSAGRHVKRKIAKETFRNFAKYLVDFFRFPKIDADYVKRYVRIEGLSNIDKALAAGKGAIVLSAHIGNWELGAFILSSLRQPAGAVVLTHQNKKINRFFTRQRMLGNLQPIEIGMALRGCYTLLRKNGLLAVLGDRDFSNSGIVIEFFGKKTLLPKGPSVLSQRLGSAIVPSFVIRQPDDTYRFVFEAPIFSDTSETEERAIPALIRRYVNAMESYIRAYPGQWYVFRKVWNNDGKLLRPDTVI